MVTIKNTQQMIETLIRVENNLFKIGVYVWHDGVITFNVSCFQNGKWCTFLTHQDLDIPLAPEGGGLVYYIQKIKDILTKM